MSRDTARRVGLIAVAAALAAALGAAGARLRNHGGSALRDRFRRGGEQTYRCDCGAEYRVTGVDRHRVYWPADAPDGSPVLGDRCVRCDAALPAGRAISTA